jgi:integrase
MGRKRTTDHDLPPGLYRKRGRYYYGRKMEALGADLTVALRSWASRRGEEITEAYTFADAARHYRIHALHKVARATQRDYEGRLKRLESVFGRTALGSITPQHVRKFLSARSAIGGTRDKAVLSLVINHAREHGLTSVQNPCIGVRGTKSKSSVYVSDEQLAAVIERSDAELATFLEFCWRTGADASVVLGFTPAMFAGETATIRRTKTGEATALSVTPRLREMARNLPFHSSLQTLRKRFWIARGDADWTIKQLRAKAATDSPNLGAAQALLGHASEQTTAVYRRRIGGREAQPIDRSLTRSDPTPSGVDAPT